MSRATPRRLLVAGAVLVAVLAAWWVATPAAVALSTGGGVTVDDGQMEAFPSFGTRGSYALRYVDHGYVTLHVPVVNRGRAAVALLGADLGDQRLRLLDPVLDGAEGGDLPITLAPGETTDVSLTVRMDNCEFYTERAMDVFDGVDLKVGVLGRHLTQHVRFDHDLVVRSPMMVTCPSRVRDRDGNQRRLVDR